MSPKVLVLGSPTGHQSLAEAIHEAFAAAGWQSKLAILDRYGDHDWFAFLYRYSPALFAIPYHLARFRPIMRLVKRQVRRDHRDIVPEPILDFKPDLVVSTQHAFNESIVDVRRSQGFLYINAIANPRSIHPLELNNDADLSIIYDEMAVDQGRRYGVAPGKLAALGWMTREAFYQDCHDRANLFGDFGLSPGRPTVLLQGGSAGTYHILPVLPAFVGLDREVQLIVVCGNNRRLFQKASAFAAAVGGRDEKLRVLALPFTDRMADLMAVSDVVVGKAAPNTLFEAVAARKPYLATTHIHGPSDGDIALIKERGLGWVEENPSRATALIRQLLANPERLHQFDRTIEEERQRNIGAASRFVALAARLLDGRGHGIENDSPPPPRAHADQARSAKGLVGWRGPGAGCV